MRRFTQRIREQAGLLPPDFRPLDALRHTYASWLASNGSVTLLELQKLLTHESPAIIPTHGDKYIDLQFIKRLCKQLNINPTDIL